MNRTQWHYCSFTIVFHKGVARALLRRMMTKGQSQCRLLIGEAIITPNGCIRDTDCGFIECRDTHGIPFGWNKKLVRIVLDEQGMLLWGEALQPSDM